MEGLKGRGVVKYEEGERGGAAVYVSAETDREVGAKDLNLGTSTSCSKLVRLFLLSLLLLLLLLLY